MPVCECFIHARGKKDLSALIEDLHVPVDMSTLGVLIEGKITWPRSIMQEATGDIFGTKLPTWAR